MSVNGLGPYPAYRESGVEWLGRLPEHWELRRLKTMVSNTVDPTRSRESGQFCLALENVESWTGRIRLPDDAAGFASQLKSFQAGDILFGKLRPYLAKVTRPERDGACVGEFLVLRPLHSNVIPSYTELVLRSRAVIEEVSGSTFGAKMPRADWMFLGGMHIPRPPVAEQRAIARFLDDADRRIRRYIRAKERLIELLQERKRALIHEAVTGRTDVQTGQPYPAYKDSGVQWLGKVPQHWEVRRLKTMVSNTVDPTRSRESGQFCLALENVESWTGRIRLPDDAAGFASQLKSFQAGDILFGKLRPYLAKVTRPERDGACVGEFLVLRPLHSNVIPSYTELVLRSRAVIEEVSGSTFGAKMPRADWMFLGGMHIPRPPVAEQRAIARFLEAADRRIRRHISATKRQIALLKEYRTRLIADVVTGKLDVREAAARLPGTDPLAADRNRAETIPPESNLHSTANEIAKEASA